MIKKYNGITLISLIITIIILIILAGVTLNMLFGENGIINRTKTAKDENEKATATETMNLKITNVQISKYAEEQRMPTLKELADSFCDDNDFEKVIEKTEVGSLTKISNENPTAIITKLKAYPYEFEINSSLQLASIDGVKIATVPVNDDDTIDSMTKAELYDLINEKIQEGKEETEWNTLNSSVKYKKKNGYVTVQINGGASGITISTNTPFTNCSIGTLPEGFRPNIEIRDTMTYGNYNRYAGGCRITTDGIIQLCGENEGAYVVANIVFPVE